VLCKSQQNVCESFGFGVYGFRFVSLGCVSFFGCDWVGFDLDKWFSADDLSGDTSMKRRISVGLVEKFAFHQAM